MVYIESVKIIVERSRLGVPLAGVSLPGPLKGRGNFSMVLVIEQLVLFCPFFFLFLMYYIFSDHIL